MQIIDGDWDNEDLFTLIASGSLVNLKTIYFHNNNISDSGMIAFAGGVLLLIAILVNPRHGILPAYIRRWRFRLTTTREDLLALAWRLEERGAAPTAGVLCHDLRVARRVSALETRWSLRQLLGEGAFHTEGDRLRLTDIGRDAARQLVRSHRL